MIEYIGNPKQKCKKFEIKRSSGNQPKVTGRCGTVLKCAVLPVIKERRRITSVIESRIAFPESFHSNSTSYQTMDMSTD